jgi:very-short-patch-repair endonuclease
MPTRDFVHYAADVLLALKPCWAMSPLVVSQLLPAKPYFDVVIFDEASQITPADAATSILRGKQLVVAGDDKQLPPTAFFTSGSADDDSAYEDEDPALMAGTGGFESILDATGPLLAFRTLTWHYRSRDERLIAFSNEHIYQRMLTTFPGADHNRVLNYVPAAWSPAADSNSPGPEVEKVVDLIFEHAQTRPEESLGVITMGIRHANRIEESLRKRLHEAPTLARQLAHFFDEDREERFFVKNIERVQGDERDAIVLSVGYGKNERGDLPYRFGPLLPEGGERRLNVAVTRAKNRLTLVSSFSSNDMAPDRSSARGVQLLRQYLQYVESGGANLGEHSQFEHPLNPFEVDVLDTLTSRGLKLTPQYGASGYRIDFAVSHPEQPGRHVLAIECDGASYHSSQSARDRDRLRQEQLERLGWRFHRIWSTDWFRNKESAADRAVMAYEQSLADVEDQEAPGPLLQVDAEDPTIRDVQRLPSPVRNAALNPYVLPGQPIGSYTDHELECLARWIRSDDLLRTEDELLDEMMRELGFQRRGKNVVARLSEAISHTKS